MTDFEAKFQGKKNKFRKRRNLVRKIMFLFFLMLFIGVVYWTVRFSSNTAIAIAINNSNIAEKELILASVNEQIQGKSFFSISPKQISFKLKEENNLLKEVVVRKYLFPYPKLFIYLIERKLWSVLVPVPDTEKNKSIFVTSEGCFVSEKFIHNPNELLDVKKIYLLSQFPPKKDKLVLLKQFLDLVLGEGFPLKGIYIDKGHNVRLVLENSVSVRFGSLDEEILSKVYKLKEAFAVAESNMYHVTALDLTLDKSAVLKVDLMTGTNNYLEKVIETQKKDFFGRKEDLSDL